MQKTVRTKHFLWKSNKIWSCWSLCWRLYCVFFVAARVELEFKFNKFGLLSKIWTDKRHQMDRLNSKVFEQKTL